MQKHYSEMYKEDLTYLPTIHDRLIIGIEKGIILKNRTYYKVINKYGKPEPKIYEPDSILYKEKGILLCLDEFKH